jgi:hypothetical protein
VRIAVDEMEYHHVSGVLLALIISQLGEYPLKVVPEVIRV